MKASSQKNSTLRVPAARRRNSAEQLLDAAGRILSERSSTDMSLSDIAEESRLNSALVKYHFKNKEGLLLALARRSVQPAMEQLGDLISMQIPVEQKIRFHVSGVIQTYAKFPYLNRLIHDLLESRDEAVVRDVETFFVAPIVEAVTALLREGVEAGVFREAEPMHIYLAVIGGCDQFFSCAQPIKKAFGGTDMPSHIQSYADFLATMLIKTLRKE